MKNDAQVYDVSNWAVQHPGGRVIYTYAGKDATDVFAGFHSPGAWALLKPLYVGELLVRRRRLACLGAEEQAAVGFQHCSLAMAVLDRRLRYGLL